MADKQNFQPALDASQNQLMLTFSASDSIDTKAGAVLGADLALAIFALQAKLDVTWFMSVPMLLAFIASGLLAVYTIWPRDSVGAIVELQKHPEYFKLDDQGLVLQLLADTQKAITLNSAQNLKKSKWCSISIICGLAGVFLLAACIIKA